MWLFKSLLDNVRGWWM